MLSVFCHALALVINLSVALGVKKTSTDGGVYSLGREIWTVTNEHENITVPGNLPSHVHLDLYAAGVIDDPLRGFNDVDLRWVANQNWTYTSGPLSKLNRHKNIKTWLVFDGLDTFVTIKFCDQVVGTTDNQFRQWYFDVTYALAKCGSTPTLSLNFGSAPKIANEINSTEPQPWSEALVAAWTFEVPNRNFVRKQQSDFGWDWSPAFTPAGPWKAGRIVQLRDGEDLYAINTVIDVYREGQINNFAPDQTKPWVVNASVDYIGSLPKDAFIEATITTAHNDSEVLFRGRLCNLYQSSSTISGTINIDRSRPRLWWPHGMGNQDMYNITLSVQNLNPQKPMLVSSRRFGFRTIFLSTGITSDGEIAQGKQPGNNWHFEINGNQFYVKGANIVPPDVFWPRTNVEQMSHMFDAMQQQNFNMVRVWSSGSYLPDFIYDLADERGILLWSEFQFSDALYPDDARFVESVRKEATDNVRRVNHHPSLACWAGGNEIENIVLPIAKALDKNNYLLYVGQYEHLYIDTLFRVVVANTRSISYTPSSGNNGWTKIDMSLPVPMVQRYDNKTDGHVYGDTEHYNYSVEFAFDQSSYPVGRFAAEFGFPSMPSLQTWRSAISEADLFFNSSVIVSRNHHYPPGGLVANMTKSLQGMGELTRAVEMYYPRPNKTNSVAEFSAWCHATQLFQADFYQTQIQFYRRGSGAEERQRGTLFWQLNDVWQAPTWAAIEYGGRWKVLPYFVRRGYQNVVASTSWDIASKKLEVWVVSDLWHAVSGQLSLSWVNLRGEPLQDNGGFPRKLSFTVNGIGGSKLLEKRLMHEAVIPDPQNALLLISTEAHGRLASSDARKKFTHQVTFLPVASKHARIQDPCLTLSYDEASRLFTVMAVKAVSLYTWLTHPSGVVGFFDDNAFVLLPGQKREIGFTVQRDDTNGSWVHGVTVDSLWDLSHG